MTASYRDTLWHGGDYNPEQWPAEIRARDPGLMVQANLSVATVGIFAWSIIQPEPDRFDWTILDETFAQLDAAGLGVILATPSAATPRWLSALHPEVDACDADGRRRKPGGRQQFCASSIAFRTHVAAVDRALAKRYGRHPALKLWHVGNESMAGCWCENCVAAWRIWLRRRYGTLETLNAQWWTAFWSQHFSTWDQVIPPFSNTGAMPAQWLDWRRFQSHQLCELFAFEAACLRGESAVPVTSNSMGFYPWVDFAKFADAMDVVSWDSYPAAGGDPSLTAMTHSMIRGLKPAAPWLLMEQTPSATNWQEHATLKPPGLLRLESWQAVAHGANSVMYFQFRRSRGGSEKFHGAIVEHAGSADARVFREVAAIGTELRAAGPMIAPTRAAAATVAIIHDWENRWALEGSGREKKYIETLQRHYRALWRRNVPVDVIRCDGDWSAYRVLLMPLMHLIRSGTFPLDGSAEEIAARVDFAAKLQAWVAGGGIVVATCLSGIVNESDLVFSAGYPGPLRDIFGVWVEETDQRPDAVRNVMVMADGCAEAGALGLARDTYPCTRLFDLLHLREATAVAHYGEDWYEGRPCLTVNRVGSGQAWWLATDADEGFLGDFYQSLCARAGGIALVPAQAGIEVVERRDGERRLLFVLNHAVEARRVALGPVAGTDLITGNRCAGSIAMAPYGVAIIELSG